MVQTPKSVTLLSAQRSWFKANHGINGRGPPEAGRMPFMPAVRLNQRSEALPKRDPLYSEGFFSDSFLLFCFRMFCSSIFWPSQRLLSERERSRWCSVLASILLCRLHTSLFMLCANQGEARE